MAIAEATRATAVAAQQAHPFVFFTEDFTMEDVLSYVTEMYECSETWHYQLPPSLDALACSLHHLFEDGLIRRILRVGDVTWGGDSVRDWYEKELAAGEVENFDEFWENLITGGITVSYEDSERPSQLSTWGELFYTDLIYTLNAAGLFYVEHNDSEDHASWMDWEPGQPFPSSARLILHHSPLTEVW